MLRRIRIILAAIFIVCITMLFLDLSGFFHTWFGWMAKIRVSGFFRWVGMVSGV